MYGLDLFSGCGGLTVALHGYVQPIAYCESEKYCQGLLVSRMASGQLPLAPIWDDIRTLQGLNLPVAPEIIYGGFPCQDISTCRNGDGLEVKRSGLFFEALRLVGELRPAFVFLENVSAITIRGAARVVGELHQKGYDCRWTTLSAKELGFIHERKRWFLLAHSNRSGRRNDLQAPTHKRNESSSKPNKAEAIDLSAFRDENFYERHPDDIRIGDGIPFWVERLRSMGNSVVPQQAREAFERLMGLTKISASS